MEGKQKWIAMGTLEEHSAANSEEEEEEEEEEEPSTVSSERLILPFSIGEAKPKVSRSWDFKRQSSKSGKPCDTDEESELPQDSTKEKESSRFIRETIHYPGKQDIKINLKKIVSSSRHNRDSDANVLLSEHNEDSDAHMRRMRERRIRWGESSRDSQDRLQGPSRESASSDKKVSEGITETPEEGETRKYEIKKVTLICLFCI